MAGKPSQGPFGTTRMGNTHPGIAEVFGVSDTAVSHWCQEYGIAKPERGYWANLKAMIQDLQGKSKRYPPQDTEGG